MVQSHNAQKIPLQHENDLFFCCPKCKNQMTSSSQHSKKHTSSWGCTAVVVHLQLAAADLEHCPHCVKAEQTVARQQVAQVQDWPATS